MGSWIIWIGNRQGFDRLVVGSYFKLNNPMHHTAVLCAQGRFSHRHRWPFAIRRLALVGYSHVKGSAGRQEQIPTGVNSMNTRLLGKVIASIRSEEHTSELQSLRHLV